MFEYLDFYSSLDITYNEAAVGNCMPPGNIDEYVPYFAAHAFFIDSHASSHMKKNPLQARKSIKSREIRVYCSHDLKWDGMYSGGCEWMGNITGH